MFDLVFTNAGMDTERVRWASFRSLEHITFFVLTLLPVAVDTDVIFVTCAEARAKVAIPVF